MQHDDRRAALGRAARPVSPALLRALAAQNGRFSPSPAREAHLAALAAGAPAVVTGQQVGLFLGPLFTLYKAASAIRVARALAVESGRPVVPVFWLQTEDHDLPEIATIQVGRPQGEPLTLSLPSSPADRASVAHATLGAEVDGATRRAARGAGAPAARRGALRAARAPLPRRRRVGRGLRRPAGRAVRRRGSRPARPARPGDRRAGRAGARACAARGRADRGGARGARGRAGRGRPRAAGAVRAGAPLSFFHPRGATGPRYRLEPDGTGYATAGGGTRHDRRASCWPRSRPTRCRSARSALLRPIVQDTLLPTAAYVGGPAEVAYFAQLGPLYEVVRAAAAAGRAARPLPRGRREDRRSCSTASGWRRRTPSGPRASSCPGCRAGRTPRARRPRSRPRSRRPFEQALRAARAPARVRRGSGLDAAIEKTARQRARLGPEAGRQVPGARSCTATRRAWTELRRVQRMLLPRRGAAGAGLRASRPSRRAAASASSSRACSTRSTPSTRTLKDIR